MKWCSFTSQWKKLNFKNLYLDHFQFVLCSLYILLGMAVIAMCFSLMQEKVVQGVRSLGRKIGIVKDDWTKMVNGNLWGALQKGSYHFKWIPCGMDHILNLQLNQLQTQRSSIIFLVSSKIFDLKHWRYAHIITMVSKHRAVDNICPLRLWRYFLQCY